MIVGRQPGVLASWRAARRVLLPLVVRGIILRRTWAVRRAARRQDDRLSAQTLTQLRRAYGADPVPLRGLGRRIALVVDADDVGRILEHSPEPFNPATREKRSALGHFEPHGVLVSDPGERPARRAFNEAALQTGRPVHDIGPAVRAAARASRDDVLRGAPATLDWDTFATASWRAVRAMMFGPGFSDDPRVTDALRGLRADANWAFLRPPRRSARRHFDAELRTALRAADPQSLAGYARTAEHAHGVDAAGQVPQWLFAFDAVIIAAYRALALVGSDGAVRDAVVEEARDGAPGSLRTARACVLESVRLWPTTLAILRDATRPTGWRSRVLPAGTGFVIVSSFFHRDAAVLPFADRFVPHIWTDGTADDLPGLVPFSAGPVSCPGRPVALTVAAELVGAWADALEPARKLPVAALPRMLDHTTLRFAVRSAR
jgi:cytochrome P450